jgi:probable rRNA maturation factor
MTKIEFIGKIGESERHSFQKIVDNILPKRDGDSIIEVEFVSLKKIAELNNQYRRKDAPTDVLSFPQKTIPGSENIIGTIIICPQFARKTEEDTVELFHHGLLHLMSYDHEINEEDWNKIYNKTKSLIR